MAWQPAYAETSDLAGWLGVSDDPGLALPIEAASRAIDKATGRQFGLTDSQTREYTPRWDRGRTVVDTDDMAAVPTLVETLASDGTVVDTVTNFVVTPRNAERNGKPYTAIEYGGMGGDWWYGYGYGNCYPHPSVRTVRVTAEFGWGAIPNAIVQATLIQAGRFLQRRTSPMPLQMQQIDDIRYQWGAGELDADIAASLGPYVRHWGAV
ncbi:Uncharacterised protein [Mycobacteroides abscessus subsp. abscessus]|nr:Uncharacterised protein [Mycobacteroides abscessus subsp. abscessus]